MATTTRPAPAASARFLYVFFSDPGHGWLRVPLTHLSEVGLLRGSFSRYSYTDGVFCYLEEDCDAPRFDAHYKARHGYRPIVTDDAEQPAGRDSFIRNLRPIY